MELDLDVLENELNLPFIVISGHINQLLIRVPWTKLGSEAVKITIDTIGKFLIVAQGFNWVLLFDCYILKIPNYIVMIFIECVLKLKTPQQRKAKKNDTRQVGFYFIFLNVVIIDLPLLIKL